MSESSQPGRPSPDLQQQAELTGHPVVDAVLGSLESLDTRPVEEHVAVYEAAHEQLRAALADAADRPSAPAPGR